jgi:hypothetical protein
VKRIQADRFTAVTAQYSAPLGGTSHALAAASSAASSHSCADARGTTSVGAFEVGALTMT